MDEKKIEISEKEYTVLKLKQDIVDVNVQIDNLQVFLREKLIELEKLTAEE